MNPTDHQYDDTVTKLHEQTNGLPDTGFPLIEVVVIGIMLIALGLMLMRLRSSTG